MIPSILISPTVLCYLCPFASAYVGGQFADSIPLLRLGPVCFGEK